MNVDRILFWIRLVVQAALDILNALDQEQGTGEESVFDPPSGFKPERIQFWLKLIFRFVLAAVRGAGEETGKSGEPTSEEVDW